MIKTEIYIDSTNKTIRFEDSNQYEIGLALLSFIELDLNTKSSEHPYLKYYNTDKEKTLAELQAWCREAVIDCLYAKYYQKNLKAAEKPTRIGKGSMKTGRDEILPPVRHLYYSEFVNLDKSITMRYKVEEISDEKNILLEVYSAPDLSTVCFIEFMKMVQFGINIRLCHNCRRFFISKGEYDTKYCDRTPEGEERTCAQIGAVNAFKTKLKENPLLAEYTKIYRRFHARKRNGIITSEQFNVWKGCAAKIRDTAISENMTVEEFIKEIDSISI